MGKGKGKGGEGKGEGEGEGKGKGKGKGKMDYYKFEALVGRIGVHLRRNRG